MLIPALCQTLGIVHYLHKLFSVSSPISWSHNSIPFQQGEVFQHVSKFSFLPCMRHSSISHLLRACMIKWMPTCLISPVLFPARWSSCNALVLFLKSHQLHSHRRVSEPATTSARIIFLLNMHNLNTH